MKRFNSDKFRKDLLDLRKGYTQIEFSQKLNINRSTLSLLESGKQIPSLEILNKVCNIGNLQPNNYFIDVENNGLLYLMGTLEESDKERISEMMDRIRIKEKYAMLNSRCN
jgi:transcriptional regulator with XRE-family HTH domain